MRRKKKKLLYIASNNLSRRSADIVNIMEMCNAFSKYGFETSLVTPHRGVKTTDLFKHYEVKYPFDIIQIQIPIIFSFKIIPGLSFLFACKFMRKITKLECDIIYTRNLWFFSLISVIYRRHCFLESHQFRFYNNFQEVIYRMLVKFSVKYGNGRVICISKKLKEQWREYGVDRSKLFVAHDSVNTKKFNNTITKIKARQILKLDVNQSIVIYTGSLMPGKGVDILLKAANIIPNINFIIVGGQKNEIHKLKKLVENNNIIFKGYAPFDKIPLYQAAADILALPNCKGSFIDDVTSPIKLFEYLASQRPIVASDMPSLLEILKNDYNALISPAGDYYKLAENISLLINDPSKGKRLAKNASLDIEKHSWDARVQFLSNIFDNSMQKMQLN